MTSSPEEHLTINRDALDLLLWAKRNPDAVRALLYGKAAVIESFWLDYLPPDDAKRLDGDTAAMEGASETGIGNCASAARQQDHALTPSALADAIPPVKTFQQRVQPWMMECFGPEIAADKIERNHRFIEEALELVQSCGATTSECHQLVDYVFSRPVGEPYQESGGVMVTHAALCLANGLDMHNNGEVELARIWTKVETIRAKQAAKPKHSPLPEAAKNADHLSGKD